MHEDNDPVMSNGTSIFEKPITNQCIRAELNLPQGKLLRKAKFSGQTKDGDGNVMGSHVPNPFLNALTFDVDFSNGKIKEFSDNVVAENIFSKVHEDGRNTQIMD